MGDDDDLVTVEVDHVSATLSHVTSVDPESRVVEEVSQSAVRGGLPKQLGDVSHLVTFRPLVVQHDRPVSHRRGERSG